MSARIIGALIAKDLRLFSRDRFFALISVLSLVAYSIIYWLMPAQVNEEFTLAVYTPDAVPAPIDAAFESAAIRYETVDSADDLRAVVEDGDYAAGVELPAEMDLSEDTRLTLVLPADAPAERNDALRALFRNLSYGLSGIQPNIQINQEILGEDRLGNQIPDRDRMLPLFAIMVLIVETMALANLIAQEVEEHTLRALMVSPMRLIDLFAAKGALGVMLAFGQASLLMLVTGGLNHQPLLMLTTLLIGAVLVTSIGFLLASIAREFLEIAAWGVLLFIILSLPSISVLFPGALSSWVELIPTYYLVDTAHQVMNFDASWGDVWTNLVILLVISGGLLSVSMVVLERKFR